MHRDLIQSAVLDHDSFQYCASSRAAARIGHRRRALLAFIPSRICSNRYCHPTVGLPRRFAYYPLRRHPVDGHPFGLMAACLPAVRSHSALPDAAVVLRIRIKRGIPAPVQVLAKTARFGQRIVEVLDYSRKVGLWVLGVHSAQNSSIKTEGRNRMPAPRIASPSLRFRGAATLLLFR